MKVFIYLSLFIIIDVIFFTQLSFSFLSNAPISKKELEKIKKEYLFPIKKRMHTRYNKLIKMKLLNDDVFCDVYKIGKKKTTLKDFMKKSLEHFNKFLSSSFTLSQLQAEMNRVKLFNIITGKALKDYGVINGALFLLKRTKGWNINSNMTLYKAKKLSKFIINKFYTKNNLFKLNKLLKEYKFQDGSNINIAEFKSFFIHYSKQLINCYNQLDLNCNKNIEMFNNKIQKLSDKKISSIAAMYYIFYKSQTIISNNILEN